MKYKVAPRTLYLTSLFKKKRAITGFVGLGQRFVSLLFFFIYYLFIDSVISQEVSLIRNFHPFINLVMLYSWDSENPKLTESTYHLFDINTIYNMIKSKLCSSLV
jgi:hypothetical protein